MTWGGVLFYKFEHPISEAATATRAPWGRVHVPSSPKSGWHTKTRFAQTLCQRATSALVSATLTKQFSYNPHG